MTTLHLQSRDARLLSLAVVYHLGRPGSELDAATLRRHEQGLGPLQPVLDAQLDQAETTLELSPYQLSRLGEALHGVVNELTQHELSEGRSVVPGFVDALKRLFPEIADQSGAALDLASEVVLLRRRLDDAVRSADVTLQTAREAEARAEVGRSKPWWKFWQR